MAPTPPPPKDGGKPAKAKSKNLEEHLHTIKVADLIVHRYSEEEALFKKAEKTAREIIEQELRDGEGMRSIGKGEFQVFFPKMTHAAGALRVSVLAERVAREIRQINPAYQALESKDANPKPAAPRRMPASAQTPSDMVDAQGRHIAGSRAMAMMAEAAGSAAEDIKLSAQDREVLDALKVAFHPVWHTKNNLITGYYCSLKRGEHAAKPQDLMGPSQETASMEHAAAKLDAAIYRRAVEAMNYLCKEGLKALLIVPLHFSTVDRLRFMGSLLEAGGKLPEAAQNLLVFELIDLPSDLTRFRLREPVSYLRTRARALLARTGFGTADLEMFKEYGFHGVSADIDDTEWKESRLLKGFERFVEDADTFKLQSFVHGVASKSLVVGAIAAGVRYMDGVAISDPVDNPKRIRPYEIDMLYGE